MPHTRPIRATRVRTGCAAVLLGCTFFASTTVSASATAAEQHWDVLDEAMRVSAWMGLRREGAVNWLPPMMSDVKRNEGLTPHVSLVARDWGATHTVLGKHLSVSDQIRLSRSSRMIVTRLRLGDDRLSPFTQLGLGQWRIDSDLMPVFPRDESFAVQLGAGLEYKATGGLAFGVQFDHTILTQPSTSSGPHLSGLFCGARAMF